MDTATDTYGRQVKITYQSVYQVLTNPCGGSAHVFVHSPKLVVIHRIKLNNSWITAVEESCSDDDVWPLKSVYYNEFTDEKLDDAISLFFALLKSQRKEFIKYMHKKLGKCIIFNPVKIPPNSDTQSYMYETLRKNVRCSLERRRSGSLTRKRKESC
jgi:hypothetical protein